MTETKPEEKSLTPAQQRAKSVQDLILSPTMKAQIQMALPRHVTPERFTRMILTQLRRVPKLLECTRESFLGSMMESAQLGLEPGVLGQCWIIPYKGTATLVVGYRGMVALAWRSNQIKSIQAKEVYDGDTFRYRMGLDRLLFHEPDPNGEEDPEKVTHVYAVIETTAGGVIADVMSRKQVERVRKRSKAGDSGPWVTDWVEMAKKTVLKRALKLAPASTELARALAVDEDADAGNPQAFEFNVTPEIDSGETAGKASDRIRDKIASAKRTGKDITIPTDADLEGGFAFWDEDDDGHERCVECGGLREKIAAGELKHADDCSLGGEK